MMRPCFPARNDGAALHYRRAAARREELEMADNATVSRSTGPLTPLPEHLEPATDARARRRGSRRPSDGSVAPSPCVLPEDAPTLARSFAEVLSHRRLERPLTAFLQEVAGIASCYGVALSIETYEGTGKYLAVLALMDLDGIFDCVPGTDDDTERFGEAFSRLARRLDGAPFRTTLRYRHTHADALAAVTSGIGVTMGPATDLELLLGADCPLATDHAMVATISDRPRADPRRDGR